MILILTNKGDIHPNPIIDRLHARGIPFFRFNTECLLTEYFVSWQCINNSIDFVLKNKKTNAQILGSEIKSVWERRPERPNESNIEDEKIRKICIDEAKGFLLALQYFLKDRFWIGNAIYDSVAASKLLQLKIATSLGIKVPDTIHTNNKSYLDSFLQSQNHVVVKSLESQSFDIDDEKHIVFWTRKHEKSEIENYPEQSINANVNFIQQYTDKKFELRITVVCDKVFACKIESQHLQDENGKIDFRQGYEGLKYSAYETPENINTFCVEYIKQMNLNFGCFDFIVTPTDEYVFLECNPNGQWLWIEQETNLPIADAITEYLIKGKR